MRANRTDELDQLKQLAKKVATHRQAVERLYAEIVDLIRRASSKGASRREVARAADMTHTRVQQILSGKYLSPRYTEKAGSKDQRKTRRDPRK